MSRLAGWKARFLSLPARSLLIQTVMAAIPAYVMQCVALPVSLCNKLDAVQRNFLWGDTDERKKIHLVSWKKVTKPKNQGGLGLTTSRTKNLGLLTKLSWDFINKPNALWAQVLHQKYLNRRGKSTNNRSITWASMAQTEPFIKKGMRWVIHNGANTSFWLDNWTGFGNLRNWFTGPLLENQENISVQEVWYNTNGWDLEFLRSFLSNNQIKAVKAVKCYPLSPNDDKLAWNYTATGTFKLSSVNQIIEETSLEANDVRRPPNWLWKAQVSPRIQYFLWILYHNSIPTRVMLQRRGCC